jgi:hypothetical protein
MAPTTATSLTRNASSSLMSSQLSARAQRLIRAGKVLHGDRFATALGASMGLSQTYITLMAAGTKSVTDKAEKRLLQTLQQERRRLKAVSAELAEIIAEIKENMHDA